MAIFMPFPGRDAVDDDTFFGILAGDFDNDRSEPFVATFKKTTWEYMSKGDTVHFEGISKDNKVVHSRGIVLEVSRESRSLFTQMEFEVAPYVIPFEYVVEVEPATMTPWHLSMLEQMQKAVCTMPVMERAITNEEYAHASLIVNETMRSNGIGTMNELHGRIIKWLLEAFEKERVRGECYYKLAVKMLKDTIIIRTRFGFYKQPALLTDALWAYIYYKRMHTKTVSVIDADNVYEAVGRDGGKFTDIDEHHEASLRLKNSDTFVRAMRKAGRKAKAGGE